MFDLAELSSVREWANRALSFGFPVDVLVNNAGAQVVPWLPYLRRRVGEAANENGSWQWAGPAAREHRPRRSVGLLGSR